MLHVQQNAIDKEFQILYRGIMKQHLNASELAKLLEVDRATVSRWVRRGIVRGAQRPSGTRPWRIPLSTYAELIKHESR